MKRSDAKYRRALERGMLRSRFVSLFWNVITQRRKEGVFTFQALAKAIGSNKGEVSRWFNGDPNWTVNTIARLTDALEVDLELQARDRRNKSLVFTPVGIQSVSILVPNPISLTETERSPVKKTGVGIAPESATTSGGSATAVFFGAGGMR